MSCSHDRHTVVGKLCRLDGGGRPALASLVSHRLCLLSSCAGLLRVRRPRVSSLTLVVRPRSWGVSGGRPLPDDAGGRDGVPHGGGSTRSPPS
jgi:hypothetical protein